MEGVQGKVYVLKKSKGGVACNGGVAWQVEAWKAGETADVPRLWAGVHLTAGDIGARNVAREPVARDVQHCCARRAAECCVSSARIGYT